LSTVDARQLAAAWLSSGWAAVRACGVGGRPEGAAGGEEARRRGEADEVARGRRAAGEAERGGDVAAGEEAGAVGGALAGGEVGGGVERCGAGAEALGEAAAEEQRCSPAVLSAWLPSIPVAALSSA